MVAIIPRGGEGGGGRLSNLVTIYNISNTGADANIGVTALNSQLNTKSDPLVFLNKQRPKMINERGSLVNFDIFCKITFYGSASTIVN